MWKILVVDDDFINRKLIKEMLGERAACDEASCGNEAILAYSHAVEKNEPYQVILLDVAMPDMDGIEVLKRIRLMEHDRGIPLGKGLPIIMVAAFKKPFMKSFIEGCDDYILKPVNKEELLKKIEQKIRA